MTTHPRQHGPRAMTDLHPTTTPPPSPRRDTKPLTPKQVMKGREGKGKHIPIVEIHWEDALATATDNWENETSITTHTAPSLTVGYLIHETPTTYTIINLTNHHHYAHGITIPKGCVTKLTHLN